RTVVGLVDTLQPLLRAGEIDLLVGTAVAAERGTVSRVLAEDAIVVAASASHALCKATRPTLKDLTRYRWALQPPGAPTRDWLDHTFDRRHLPRPDVQVESTMLLMLPALIAETGLLSFISRHHLAGSRRGARLREVPLKEATMRRKLVVTYREGGLLAPTAHRLVARLELDGRPFYFCSAGCRAKFAANPQAYLDPPRDPPSPAPDAVDGTIFTCPMHPEIRQQTPGSCPKCGMALEPVMPTLDDSENP